jgi:hypothetical protein
MSAIGDSKFVLLGEASHGTHEFYQTRAEITKRLITERGDCCTIATKRLNFLQGSKQLQWKQTGLTHTE